MYYLNMLFDIVSLSPRLSLSRLDSHKSSLESASLGKARLGLIQSVTIHCEIFVKLHPYLNVSKFASLSDALYIGLQFIKFII